MEKNTDTPNCQDDTLSGDGTGRDIPQFAYLIENMDMGDYTIRQFEVGITDSELESEYIIIACFAWLYPCLA